MYHHLKGNLIEIHPTSLVMEVNGVGYDVKISLHTYSLLEHLKEAKVYTHLVVRENLMELYGFFTTLERRIFTYLISVSGIGPNTGLIVLSSMTSNEVVHAIVNENELAFKKVKGVGPKTAKRLIIELKEKMVKESLSSDELEDSSVSVASSDVSEATSALVSLGFQKQKVSKLIKDIAVKGEGLGVEELIKEALKRLS